MKKSIFTLLVLLLVTTACTVRPPEGHEREAVEGQRIISTSVALCQMLDHLELDLVGVPETAFQLPERYSEAVQVGPPMTPDLEIIMTLDPTDVLSPSTLQYDLRPKFQSIGAPATFVNLLSVQGMLKSIEQLGQKYERASQAQELTDNFERFMEEYNETIASKRKPRVLLLMGIPGSYMVATERSYVGNLVKLAGGVNVYENRTEALLTVNTEDMVQKNPDIILRAAHALPDLILEMFAEEFTKNDIWKHFRAVEEERVYDLNFQLFGMSATLNYQEALLELKKILYDQE